MIETEYTEIEMRCAKCHTLWPAPVARTVNVGTHPDARLGILIGTMHKSHCPYCKKNYDVDAIFDYYDPDQKLVIQWRPRWEYRAGGGEEWYWKRYEDLVMKYAEVDVRVDVVFGFDEMIAKHLGGEEAVAAAHEEWNARKIGSAVASAAAETDDTGSSA